MARLRSAGFLQIAVGLIVVQAWLIADAGGTAMALTLSSSAFTTGGKIPAKYTCEGDDVSPPLSFSGAPQGTKSFALILDDPDAPDPSAPKRVWVHWVVLNLPPEAKDLAENVSAAGLPAGTVQGINDFQHQKYDGPCPPIGRHRYFHKLYALDTTLPAKALRKADIESAIKGHVLAQAELMGTFQKGDP